MTTGLAAVLNEKQGLDGRRDMQEKVVQISARNFNFYYGAFHALKNINIEILRGHVTAFIGPSGCGKSTFLRCFNRMFELYPEQRAEGELLLEGQNILGKRVDATSLQIAARPSAHSTRSSISRLVRLSNRRTPKAMLS